MALVDVPPFNAWAWGAFLAHTNVSLSATNTRFAWVVEAPKTGNIRKLYWRTGTVTTSQSITWSMQDPSTTTGFPDGTADQSVTRASIASNTWYTETFSADRAVTAGDPLSFVVEWTSTTGTADISVVSSPEYAGNYLAAFVSGAWQKGLASTNRGLVGYLEYDDGSVAPIYSWSIGIATNTDFNNAGTYREYGLYFRPQVGLRVIGIGWDGRSGGDLDLVLYAANGTTVLASKSLDKDIVFSATATNNFALFSSKVTLTAGTWYHAMVKPTSATNVRINWLDTNASAALAAQPFGFGADGYLARKDGSNVLTYVQTSKPWVWLICDAIEVGSAGGGLLTHPGMTGGLNG